MTRRVSIDRLKFFDSETHDKLTNALMDIAAQLSARGFKVPKKPDLSAVVLDDGSLRVTVAAKHVAPRHFDVPAGIWKEMSEEEAAIPDEPMRPTDPEGYRRAVAANLADRERWYRDNESRHAGATSALVVFDRTPQSMAKLQQLAEEQPDVAEFASLWTLGNDELLAIHLAVRPDQSAAFPAATIEELIDRVLAHIKARVRDVAGCAIISPSSSSQLEQVFRAWEALGGRPVPPITRAL